MDSQKIAGLGFFKREGDFLKEKRGLMGFLEQKKSYLSLSSTLRLKTRLK
jgi:hypothetical protein